MIDALPIIIGETFVILILLGLLLRQQQKFVDVLVAEKAPVYTQQQAAEKGYSPFEHLTDNSMPDGL